MVTHLQSGLNLQPPDDCFLQSYRIYKSYVIRILCAVLSSRHTWFFCSHLGWGYQLEAAMGNRPSRAFSLTASSLSLWPSLSLTLNSCRHLHILFHNAQLLPIRSHNILPLIYTGASLIAWSRFKYTYKLLYLY